jgi:NCS1 family nucleobase:cation symporter-1
MKLGLFRPSSWSLVRQASIYGPSARWSNEDMDPVPLEKRTWTTWNYVAYWISDATNTGIWQLASSMLAIGLSWRQALPAIAVAHCIIAVATRFSYTIVRRSNMILAGRHGLKWNHWSTIAHFFPCTK